MNTEDYAFDVTQWPVWPEWKFYRTDTIYNTWITNLDGTGFRIETWRHPTIVVIYLEKLIFIPFDDEGRMRHSWDEIAQVDFGCIPGGADIIKTVEQFKTTLPVIDLLALL